VSNTVDETRKEKIRRVRDDDSKLDKKLTDAKEQRTREIDPGGGG
jgi:hypothetical protein